MSTGEIASPVIDVDVSDVAIGRLRIQVPSSWTVTPAAGRNRVVFVDVDAHVGQGFLPNVSIRIDPPEESDELPASNVVLSDRTVDGPNGRRQVRTLLGNLPDELLVQQVTTLDSVGISAVVVASATEAQWASLAQAFDAVSESAVVEGVPG